MEDPSGALSTAIQQSGRNPSVFEIIAEESLHASTQPAIRHVIKVSFHLSFYHHRCVPMKFIENTSKWT